MNQEQILQKLTQLIRDLLNDDSIVLTLETTAEDVEGWDSLNHINIIVGTEALFKIKFQTAETEDLRNVGHFVALIEKKLATKKA